MTQLLVGLYMLVYLGLIGHENMQIEGFWYYLFTGVFEAAITAQKALFIKYEANAGIRLTKYGTEQENAHERFISQRV